jgi:hypothetical protein
LVIHKKLVKKGAFWHLLKAKIIPRKLAANAAIHTVDNSRLSTERVTPFFGFMGD